MFLFELDLPDNNATLMDALRDFLPFANDYLKLEKLPAMHLVKEVETSGDQPTFGCLDLNEYSITLQAVNRHTVDILRTLAHELVHCRQYLDDNINNESGETGSEQENEANSEAGVILRNFSKQFPAHLRTKPITL
jgi:hypothetical protein